jgi:hypothetical protein
MPIALPRIMNKRLLTAALISSCLGLGAGIPAAIASTPARPLPAAAAISHADSVAAPRTAPSDQASDTARYAAAERAQPKAADFEGGAAVFIVGSTTAVLLAVILLLVIL